MIITELHQSVSNVSQKAMVKHNKYQGVPYCQRVILSNDSYITLAVGVEVTEDSPLIEVIYLGDTYFESNFLWAYDDAVKMVELIARTFCEREKLSVVNVLED